MAVGPTSSVSDRTASGIGRRIYPMNQQQLLKADAPLAAIDALRGYAITLVIASHTFPMVRELPWTVKRFSNLGFFGVQLFFVVSCFTLARSWRRRERVARPGLRDFALRRLFRIAPAYFLATLGYLWIWPDAAIGMTRIATFLTFTNGWSPAQMPTVLGVWVGVPGGWSIEAEFALRDLPDADDGAPQARCCARSRCGKPSLRVVRKQDRGCGIRANVWINCDRAVPILLAPKPAAGVFMRAGHLRMRRQALSRRPMARAGASGSRRDQGCCWR